MGACYLLKIVAQLCIYCTVRTYTVELNALVNLLHRDRCFNGEGGGWQPHQQSKDIKNATILYKLNVLFAKYLLLSKLL